MKLSKTIKQILANDKITLVDVGATGGVGRPWKKYLPFLKVLTFEPDKREFSEENKHNVINFPFALGDSEREVNFNLTRSPMASSVFTPDYKFLESFPNKCAHDIVKTEKIKLHRLHDVLASSNINIIDFIKLDTQGADLMILKGAKSLLESVFGIQIEVEFNHTYVGRPSFGEIDTYLKENGFVLFDLRREYWKRNVGNLGRHSKGQLIWADALYFKSFDAIAKKLDDNSIHACPNLIKNAISISVIYGHYDYAIELCNKAIVGRLMSSVEGEMILRLLNKVLPYRFFLPSSLRSEYLGKAHRIVSAALFELYSRTRSHWRNFTITDQDWF